LRRAHTVQTHIYINIYVHRSISTHTHAGGALPAVERGATPGDSGLEARGDEQRAQVSLSVSQSVGVCPSSLCLCPCDFLPFSWAFIIDNHSYRPPHSHTPTLQHSGRLWSRLETTPELRDHLVRSPFVKYAGYGFEREQQTAPAPADSCEADGAGDCEVDGKGKGKWKGKGKEEGVYWFAEFGARNLHVGGPIQVTIENGWMHVCMCNAWR
jgi:hypothetical protein